MYGEAHAKRGQPGTDNHPDRAPPCHRTDLLQHRKQENRTRHGQIAPLACGAQRNRTKQRTRINRVRIENRPVR